MADKNVAKRTVFRSGALAAIHEGAGMLASVGAIDAKEFSRIEKLTLGSPNTPKFEPLKATTFSAKKVQQIRAANNVSQGVFAKVLNASISTIQKWETGEKKPSGPAIRLLDIIDKNGIWIVSGVSGHSDSKRATS